MKILLLEDDLELCKNIKFLWKKKTIWLIVAMTGKLLCCMP